MLSLRNDLNSLFDQFLSPGSASGVPKGVWGRWDDRFLPSADLAGNSKEIVVSLELPGVEEKDVEVTIERSCLRVRGEKKREEKSEKGGFHRSERVYGMFERLIPLPDGLETDSAKASFRKGVLKVRIPRTREAQSVRKRIDVVG